ncbi:MAG TPA: hypothetical protein VM238_01175 [Phycisphaerae bacterium]|nr:hypothetical protein [Phycisphaerae bacterium]
MMGTRASAFLLSSIVLVGCVWIAGCGGDDPPAQTSADTFIRPRKLEPDITPPPEAGPNVSGSLDPAAAAPAPGTAAPEPGTPAPEPGTPEPEPGTPEPEPGTPEPEPGTPAPAAPEPGAETEEPSGTTPGGGEAAPAPMN